MTENLISPLFSSRLNYRSATCQRERLTYDNSPTIEPTSHHNMGMAAAITLSDKQTNERMMWISMK